MKLLSFITLGATLACFSAAHAAPIVFDFENTTVTDDTGKYTTLSQSAGGLTATFTRPGSKFDIDNLQLSGNAPASFGTHTLSPISNSTSATPFFVNFSQGLTDLSFQAGNFSNTGGTISLQVFSGLNGTGTLLDTVALPYGSASLLNGIALLTATTATPFLSAEFIGGSTQFPNSVFYDNFSATVASGSVSPVPLPASLPLFAVACVGLAFAGRYAQRSRPSA